MAKAHPLIEVRMATEFTGFEQNGRRASLRRMTERGRRATKRIRGSYLVSCEGARSVARKDLGVEFEGFTYPERTINIEVAYDFGSTATPSATTSPIRSNTPTCSTGRARPTAGASISRPHRRRRGRADAARGDAGAAQEFSRHRPRLRDLRLQPLHRASARGARSSASAAWCWPATPPTSTARSAAWA